MPHLIKLESGDYLNLDNLVKVEIDAHKHKGIIIETHMIGGSVIRLSPKDLEKIEKIAEGQYGQTTLADMMKKERAKLSRDKEYEAAWRKYNPKKKS